MKLRIGGISGFRPSLIFLAMPFLTFVLLACSLRGESLPSAQQIKTRYDLTISGIAPGFTRDRVYARLPGYDAHHTIFTDGFKRPDPLAWGYLSGFRKENQGSGVVDSLWVRYDRKNVARLVKGELLCLSMKPILKSRDCLVRAIGKPSQILRQKERTLWIYDHLSLIVHLNEEGQPSLFLLGTTAPKQL